MNVIFQVAVVIFLYMTIIFLIALLKKDNSIVDIFWGPGFILVAVYSSLSGTPPDLPRIILNLMVVAWGMRLAFHVYYRNKGRGEDFRYKAWREKWKYFVLRSYLQVFMLQGLFMLIIASPVYAANNADPRYMQVNDFIGIVIFLAGFYFEAMADRQLSVFRKDPANKGKIITSGLWGISRHPNYFGEALIWWGIFAMAAGFPGGILTIVSPLVITLLLRFVSGVPMLEKKYEGRPDWAEYKNRTAPFVPFVKFL